MKIYYGGEDEVTRKIAKRLAQYISKKLKVSNVTFEDLGIRERGSAVLRKLPQIVRLGKKYPIVFVFDSDGECVLEVLKKTCPEGWQDTFTTLDLAIDEGESWLLADREGFADYFGIELKHLEFSNDQTEVTFPYQTSLYIMKNLVPKSNRKDVIQNMSCTDRGKKPSTYNLLWNDYIEKVWDASNAAVRANSLQRALKRIEKKIAKYLDN